LGLGTCVELDEQFRRHVAHSVVINAAQIREALAEGGQGGIGHGRILTMVVAVLVLRLVFRSGIGMLSSIPVPWVWDGAWLEVSFSVAPGIVVDGWRWRSGLVSADGGERIKTSRGAG
jgi:hypothetical protein